MNGLAQINGATVTMPNGETLRGQYASRFIIHRGGKNSAWFSASLPCGATLGRYPSVNAAKSAALSMSPLVADWEASDLYKVFGSEETARKAYDLAREFMK